MRKRELEARIIALEARCAALEQSLAFWRQPVSVPSAWPATPLNPAVDRDVGIRSE